MCDAARKSNLLKNVNILIHLIMEKQDRIGFRPNKRNVLVIVDGPEWDPSAGLCGVSDPILSLFGGGDM